MPHICRAVLNTTAYNTMYGGSGSFTGPTLAGCKVSADGLVVQFNTSLLRGDSLSLQPIPPQLPSSGGSQLFVQVNASLFCMEPLCVVNVTTGRCEPKVAVCPPWAGGDGSVVESGLLDSGWVPLNFTLASPSSVLVDLSPLQGAAPTSVRYAWGIVDCCDHTDPLLYVTHGCGAVCPIMSSSGLPANPFQARIVDGRCQCVPPQRCDWS